MTARAFARAVAARPRARPRGIGVDVGAALNLVGSIFQYLGLVFVFPTAIAIGYGDAVWPFLVAGLAVSGFGVGLDRATRGAGTVGRREGYLVVALVWLLIAVFGALPYLFVEPQLAHPIDAFFESMSGFSTTSSSVLTDVEGVSRSIAMWRQYTVWLGGLGIIVVFLAVLPRLRVGGRQALVQHEMPGPELGLGETVRQSGRRFIALYVGLTALEIIVLTTFGLTHVDDRMTLFNAVAHSFTTMGTGGFSTEARSIEPFAPASQWVIAFFMVVAGSNFALLFAAIVRRRVAALASDEEFRAYLGVLLVASVVVLIALLHQDTFAGGAAIRHAVFNTTSMLTTTGFASADFNQWIPLSAVVLFGVVLIGPSAGSTGGSIKVVRHVIIAKMLRRELDETVHPAVVRPLPLNATRIGERTLGAIIVFVLLYLGICAAGATLILLDSALENVDLTAFESIAAAATTLGNAGPGLGFAGPMGSFAPFSDFSTIVMAGLMYLGRLELTTVLVLFTPQYWRI
jgi:trk system potassium uptake protein TrkH